MRDGPSGAANLFVPYLERGEAAALLAGAAPRADERAPSTWRTEIATGDDACHVVARVDLSRGLAGVQALAEACGGICVARLAPGGAPIVVDAGVPLRESPGFTWERAFEHLGGSTWTEHAMRFDAEGALAEAPAHGRARRAITTRVAFANVARVAFASAWREVAHAVHPSARWTARATPLAALPFVVVELDAACDPAWIEGLARRLDAYAAATQVAKGGSASGWWLRPDGRADAVLDAGAEQIVGVWRDWAVVLGEAAGLARFPRTATVER